MTLLWTPLAIRDLAAIREFISRDDPGATQRVVQHVIQNVEVFLPSHPQMGRSGRVSGTRELVIPGTPFIVPYRIRGDQIQILRVYHSARRWPGKF